MRKILIPAIALGIAAASLTATPASAKMPTLKELDNIQPQGIFNKVFDMTGSAVRIRYVHNSEVEKRWIHEGIRWNYDTATYYDKWASPGFTHQVLTFKSKDDVRCVHWSGIGRADGWWHLPANDRVKIFSGVKVAVYALSMCDGRKIEGTLH
jgi:hypothetical protein